MSDHDHTATHGGIGNSTECLICPICVVLQALTTARPEVTGHLVAAGRELTKALEALVDAQAKAHDDAHDGDEPLERVNVD
jgi:hypothetical protein